MSTNSRTGRQRSVDPDAVFALALDRARAPLPPAEAVRAEASALLSRRGRVQPLRAQVPPT